MGTVEPGQSVRRPARRYARPADRAADGTGRGMAAEDSPPHPRSRTEAGPWDRGRNSFRRREKRRRGFRRVEITVRAGRARKRRAWARHSQRERRERRGPRSHDSGGYGICRNTARFLTARSDSWPRQSGSCHGRKRHGGPTAARWWRSWSTRPVRPIPPRIHTTRWWTSCARMSWL